ncbi:helix-turn-helix domain-containing protein [Piscinibacter sp.]|uniref:helix-turn-helix domain-containing protein n=1 Tax=Piscinibacter sp. TaxID=1903157 RepID=UPI002CBDA757|nr:helix-turn-helix domain-containing protein [Albitalea sp.]HUG21717.1 helix-turn-helix domain-containing protein [Albitalea sp.]
MKPMLISDVGWCKAMKDAFAQHGLDVDALLEEAGVAPTATIDVRPEGERGLVVLQIAAGRRPMPPQRYDFYTTVLLHGIRWLTGRTVRPLAVHHPGFQHSRFSPTEITFALGFSDPSNFYRACKRWFGRSPGTMRSPN